ncbi:hypothetical protein EVG20_g1699 [Dentipellis fragilis]|uniref:F-box domain-containing protein n=1 Tax=Dentipellis fragilis TaxID=205917 RepID=A0A4Y9Z944_9AGAM|nr:hypothetical protein EVG20_g1699 [Dentipellis fragilis]
MKPLQELLPMELLVMIFRQLSVKNLLRVTSTCKKLYSLVMETVELRYMIELAIGDLCDNSPSSAIGLQERLRLLLERRTRWRSLSHRVHTAIICPLQDHGRPYGFDFFRDLLFDDTVSGNKESFNPLAVVLDQIPTGKYKLSLSIDGRENVRLEKFAIDASQDLLVLLEENFPDTSHLMWDDNDNVHGAGFTIYLRTLSSRGQRAHPACANPVLVYEFPTYFWDEATVKSLTLTRNTVGVHAYDGVADCIAIWDWQEGELKADMNSRDAGFSLAGFCFLTPTEFIVISNTRTGRHNDTMYLHMFIAVGRRFQDTSNWEDDAGVVHVVRFAFPSLSGEDVYMTSHVYTGPFVSTRQDPALFSPALAARIYALRLRACYGGESQQQKTNCILFIHLRDLAKLVMKYDVMDSGKGEPPVVPWREWGPDHTRLFVQDLPSKEQGAYYRLDWTGTYEPSQGWIHGTRAVCTVADPRTQGPLVTQVLDFNTRDRGRGPVPIPAVPDGCTPAEALLVTEATTVHRPEIFKEPITTRLPYYTAYVRDSPLFVKDHHGLGAMMLDGERLYGLTEHYSQAMFAVALSCMCMGTLTGLLHPGTRSSVQQTATGSFLIEVCKETNFLDDHDWNVTLFRTDTISTTVIPSLYSFFSLLREAHSTFHVPRPTSMEATPRALFTLPSELVDHVTFFIDTCADLVSLASTCTTCRDIVIPRHLDWRYICIYPLSDRAISLWKHLIDRPHLASYVRTLFLKLDYVNAGNDHIPATFSPAEDRAEEDMSNEEKEALFLRAFRSMSRPHRIEMDRAYHSPMFTEDTQGKLWSVISRLPTLDHLSVANGSDMQCDHLDMMAELKTVQIEGIFLDQKWDSFHSLLRRCSNLQDLYLPCLNNNLEGDLVAFKLSDCRIPTLKRLVLSQSSVYTSAAMQYLSRFVEAHPSIENLSWRSPSSRTLRDDALPRLKVLEDCHPLFVERILEERRYLPLEALGGIRVTSSNLALLGRVNPKTLRKLQIELIHPKCSHALQRNFRDYSILESL